MLVLRTSNSRGQPPDRWFREVTNLTPKGGPSIKPGTWNIPEHRIIMIVHMGIIMIIIWEKYVKLNSQI